MCAVEIEPLAIGQNNAGQTDNFAAEPIAAVQMVRVTIQRVTVHQCTVDWITTQHAHTAAYHSAAIALLLLPTHKQTDLFLENASKTMMNIINSSTNKLSTIKDEVLE